VCKYSESKTYIKFKTLLVPRILDKRNSISVDLPVLTKRVELFGTAHQSLISADADFNNQIDRDNHSVDTSASFPTIPVMVQ
jgi:hypothetical protein